MSATVFSDEEKSVAQLIAPSKERHEKRHAFLVGAQHYQAEMFSEKPLKYPIADVDMLQDEFQSMNYRTRCVKDPVKTRDSDDVLEALKTFVAEVGMNDLLVVVFSGHGAAIQEGNDPSRSYLIPVNFRPFSQTEVNEVKEKQASLTSLIDQRCIPLSEVLKVIEEGLPRGGIANALVFTDCCRSGGNLLPHERSGIPPENPPGSRIKLVTSCRSGEKSFEKTALGHGVFSYYLAAALRTHWDRDPSDPLDFEKCLASIRLGMDSYNLHPEDRGGLTRTVIFCLNRLNPRFRNKDLRVGGKDPEFSADFKELIDTQRAAGVRRPRLCRYDFSGCNLSGMDLENVDMDNCVFNGTNLSRAKLCRSSLQHAQFEDIDIAGTDFSHAQLQGSEFRSGSRDHSTSFRFAKMTGVKGLAGLQMRY